MSASRVAEYRLAHQELSRSVRRQVSYFQVVLLSVNTHHNESQVRSSMARLRRQYGAPPGSDPGIWDDTIGLVPELLLGRGDSPSIAETSVHTVMTLFAFHQQSQRQEMHKESRSPEDIPRSLGSAMARLALVDKTSAQAVRRRFDSVMTACAFEEIQAHMRSIVSRLRAEGIGLDYGLLVSDLMALSDPRQAPGVRLRWGRDNNRVLSDRKKQEPKVGSEEISQ